MQIGGVFLSRELTESIEFPRLSSRLTLCFFFVFAAIHALESVEVTSEFSHSVEWGVS